MRRLAVVVLPAVFLVACAGGGGPKLPRIKGLAKGAELSYAQVQAVDVGLSAAQVVDAWGEPNGRDRRPDGTVARMSYAALDAKGGKNRLLLDFDERERLVRKTFTGQVLMP
jgi:hypothetical protein